MSAPYSISLLNDLHNHFPDLLYQPQRFQSVPDVLQYVISVANQNPYERARNAYQSPSTIPAPAPAPAPTTSSIRNNRSIEETSAEYYQIIHGARLPETEIVFSSRPSRSSSSRSFLGRNWLGGDSSTDTLLTNIIGQMFEAPSLQNFLDQPVTVHPTEEQIHHHTTLTTTTRTIDDNCAICQDPIEQGQRMRILNYCTHSFHVECIDTWFATHVTCPTCRHDIRNNSQ
jgi:hypothetical protein